MLMGVVRMVRDRGIDSNAVGQEGSYGRLEKERRWTIASA
jgi:hypothetical protein